MITNKEYSPISSFFRDKCFWKVSWLLSYPLWSWYGIVNLVNLLTPLGYLPSEIKIYSKDLLTISFLHIRTLLVSLPQGQAGWIKPGCFWGAGWGKMVKGCHYLRAPSHLDHLDRLSYPRQSTFDLCIIDSTDEPLAPWEDKDVKMAAMFLWSGKCGCILMPYDDWYLTHLTQGKKGVCPW